MYTPDFILRLHANQCEHGVFRGVLAGFFQPTTQVAERLTPAKPTNTHVGGPAVAGQLVNTALARSQSKATFNSGAAGCFVQPRRLPHLTAKLAGTVTRKVPTTGAPGDIVKQHHPNSATPIRPRDGAEGLLTSLHHITLKHMRPEAARHIHAREVGAPRSRWHKARTPYGCETSGHGCARVQVQLPVQVQVQAQYVVVWALHTPTHSVPHLQLDGHAVHVDHAGSKVDPDRQLIWVWPM